MLPIRSCRSLTMDLPLREARSLNFNYSSLYRRRQHDCRRRYSVRGQSVDQLLQMLNGGNGYFHNKRIAACSSVTFEHLFRLLCHFNDVAVVDARNAHSNECSYRQADLRGVDLDPVTRDYPGVL